MHRVISLRIPSLIWLAKVAQAYKQQELMKLMPRIRAAFLALDASGDGQVDMDEVHRTAAQPQVISSLFELKVHILD